jgi:predicted alpha/beta-hydrolase family hydrolase
MSEQELRIEVPGRGSVSAIATAPEGDPTGWTFAYAPGAGSNVQDPFGEYACRALAGRGFACVRFQFPYQEAGKRGPDRPQVLEDTWTAAIDQLRPPAGQLAVGGRSMGGRIASQVVAKGTKVDALTHFAYPLHPPGRPENRRVEHLPHLAVPTFFCSGTSDAFASPGELREVAGLVPNATLHLLEHADHGFNVPRSSGRIREDIWAEATQAAAQWLLSLKA